MTLAKLIVAKELLDQSLRLYDEGDAYFASLHLAGAAEELLGKAVESLGDESAFQNYLSASLRIAKHLAGDDGEITKNERTEMASGITFPRNATKHFNVGGDLSVNFDPRAEAYDLLDRAVSNFNRLASLNLFVETDRIHQFNDRVANRQDVP